MLDDLAIAGLLLLSVIVGSIFWVKILGITDRLATLERRADLEDRNR